MEINELKKKTVSGVVWRLFERLFAQVITLIVSIVLARIILPEEYGVVALVTVFITLANVLVVNGLGTSLVQGKDVTENDFSTMFYTSIVFSVSLYLLLFFISPLIAKLYKNNGLILVLRIMALKIPIASINSIQQAYVSRKMIYKKFFYATLIGTLISGCVGIIMALKGMGVWALVAQYLSNSIIDTLVLFIVIDWKPKLIFEYHRFKKLFKYGSSIMASSFIGTFFGQLKSLIIGVKYKPADLAYYNKGDQFPSIIYNNVSLTFDSVFFTTLSKIQDNKKILVDTLSKMISISSLILFPLLIGLAAIGESLIKVLLTDRWLFCVTFMQIFCIQYCFGLVGTINIQSIKSVGRSDIVLKLELIKKPLYLLFIIIGMLFGPIGISIFNLLYDIIGTLINCYANKKVINYSIFNQIKDFLPKFLCSILMGGIVFAVGFIIKNVYLCLVFQILTGIIVYILLGILFFKKEFSYIIDFVKKIKEN